jgi:hypothetical protein
LEHAREVLHAYLFYPQDHQDLVKDHVGHAAAILGDAIDLIAEVHPSVCFKEQPAQRFLN